MSHIRWMSNGAAGGSPRGCASELASLGPQVIAVARGWFAPDRPVAAGGR